MRLLIKSVLSLLILFVFASLVATAQSQPQASYQPTHEEMLQRYGSVALKDSISKGTVYKNNIHAHWLENGTAFWYINLLKDSAVEYILVNASTGGKHKAFNNSQLAQVFTK